MEIKKCFQFCSVDLHSLGLISRTLGNFSVFWTKWENFSQSHILFLSIQSFQLVVNESTLKCYHKCISHKCCFTGDTFYICSIEMLVIVNFCKWKSLIFMLELLQLLPGNWNEKQAFKIIFYVLSLCYIMTTSLQHLTW